MATITKRGGTYRIRAYCGYDAHGKQVTRSMTRKPAPGMTPNQIKKEVTLPHAERTEKDCYSLEEAQAFWDSLEQAPTKYRAFFVLAIYGGFRRGGAAGLRMGGP